MTWWPSARAPRASPPPSAAARTRARILLVKRSAALSGAASLRNVLGYCGLWTCIPQPLKAVAGVTDELLTELATTGGRPRSP